MAMNLCIDEKDEERESEAQSAVRAKKRAPPLLYSKIFENAKIADPLGGGVGERKGGEGGARFSALTAD